MAMNEYGERLDSNGYAPSILSQSPTCLICGWYRTARHEVFFGPYRDKSKRLGLWANLCPWCHQNGPNAIHRNHDEDLRLKSGRRKGYGALRVAGGEVPAGVREVVPVRTCPIIAIDPGNAQSGYCVIDRNTLRPLEFGKVDNAELLRKLASATEQGWRWAVIEMVASYGMSVGREVFDTVLWIGRFYQALNACCPVRLLCRIEEKRHICHNTRANDAAIRRALIDRFADHDLKNGRGTKRTRIFLRLQGRCVGSLRCGSDRH